MDENISEQVVTNVDNNNNVQPEVVLEQQEQQKQIRCIPYTYQISQRKLKFGTRVKLNNLLFFFPLPRVTRGDDFCCFLFPAYSSSAEKAERT